MIGIGFSGINRRQSRMQQGGFRTQYLETGGWKPPTHDRAHSEWVVDAAVGPWLNAGTETWGNLMSEFDFDFLSLSFSTVGLFFICCAVMYKKPRHILEEAFGIYRGGLRDLKASVFKRNQVVAGFLCVVLAIVFNIFGSGTPAGTGTLDRFAVPFRVVLIIGFIPALAGVLNYFCRLWSKRDFKAAVASFVKEYNWPFEQNMVLTQEIGKLLGVDHGDSDTVETYVSRLRDHLELPRPAAGPGPRRLSRFS